MKKNLYTYLAGNEYPGRGICIGRSPDGTKAMIAYWIMGRSANSRNRVFDAIPAIAQKDMQSADTNLSRSTENVERHLIPSIEAHPETVFKIYMPPYSVGYWFLMTREGISEQQFRSRRLLCEKLLDYPNVEIYDYSSRIDWITDLNQYFDYSHHSGEVSDRLMRAMAAGENRVFSVSDMEAGSERIRQAVADFAETYYPN